MLPTYESENVKLYHADCFDVLAEIGENSVDAIVTDPPYGLSNHRQQDVVACLTAWLQGEPFTKKGGGFMGREWDSWVPGPEIWRECLRVMKPGGHLLCFAGTRSVDLMGISLRLAGWETRECLIWCHSQGFPKSQDIGKALDRQRNDVLYHVTAFIADARDKAGYTNSDIDKHFGFSGMAGHWTSSKSQPAIPTCEQWLKLKELLHLDDSMDAEVWRLNGRKGKPSDNWTKREIVGKGDAGLGRGNPAFDGGYRPEYNITAPATDLAKQWDGWGSATKPALEPILLCRKPLSERTIAQNVARWGTGGLNIDACRVECMPGDRTDRMGGTAQKWGTNTYAQDNYSINVKGSNSPANQLGRFPPNLLLDGSDEVVALFPESKGQLATVGPQHGEKKSINVYGDYGARHHAEPRGDSGSAARFYPHLDYDEDDLEEIQRLFYCPKAAKGDRDQGCDDLAKGNNWPTVKPTPLLQWLVRLITPPGGIVLDPFLGSGSTLKAAIREGFGGIGIEIDEEAFAIAELRVIDALKKRGQMLPGF